LFFSESKKRKYKEYAWGWKMTICKKAKDKLAKMKKFDVSRKEIKKCWDSLICPNCGCSDINIIHLELVGECYQCKKCKSTHKINGAGR